MVLDRLRQGLQVVGAGSAVPVVAVGVVEVLVEPEHDGRHVFLGNDLLDGQLPPTIVIGGRCLS